ncbi:MAG: NUDIX hydrolase [Aestuariivirga sp.]
MTAFPRLGVSACVWKGHKVLLVQRAKAPLTGSWYFPGGHVELGETALAAARRELLEETGVSADLTSLIGIYDVIRRDAIGAIAVHYAIVCYGGLWREGEASPASDALAARWFDPTDFGAIDLDAQVRDAIQRTRLSLSL